MNYLTSFSSSVRQRIRQSHSTKIKDWRLIGRKAYRHALADSLWEVHFVRPSVVKTHPPFILNCIKLLDKIVQFHRFQIYDREFRGNVPTLMHHPVFPYDAMEPRLHHFDFRTVAYLKLLWGSWGKFTFESLTLIRRSLLKVKIFLCAQRKKILFRRRAYKHDRWHHI